MEPIAKWSRWLPLLVVLGVGCAGAEPRCGSQKEGELSVDGDMCESRLKATLAMSPEFTVEQQERIVAGADAWRVATGGRADVRFTIGEPADIRPVCPDWLAPEVAAATNSHGWICFRLSDAGMPWLTNDATHEFGHYFGLAHDPDPTAIMYWMTTPEASLSARDIAHFDRLWAERVAGD